MGGLIGLPAGGGVPLHSLSYVQNLENLASTTPASPNDRMTIEQHCQILGPSWQMHFYRSRVSDVGQPVYSDRVNS